MAAKGGAFGYKLYVGNLPWTIASRQLKEYFSQFGHVPRAVVIFDKTTGMSKGFGFVTFTSQKSVSVVQNQTNLALEGNALNVSTASTAQQSE